MTITQEINNPWNTDNPVSYSSMWIGTELCQAHIRNKISGCQSDWLTYVMEHYMVPALGKAASSQSKEDYSVLILGANEGWIERTLCSNGFTGRIIASDIADKALARAKKQSEALGYTNIEYVVADLNKDKFEGPFDFIFAEGVLHHIENIEECLQDLNGSLSENGVLIAPEFVGPVRFQLPEEQVRWINTTLNILPKALRPFPGDPEGHLPGTIQDNSRVYYVPPTEKSIIDMDPSEALSGPRLKTLFPKVFNIVEKKGFGGTLLSYMTGHFDFERANKDPIAQAWLQVLINIEDTLIKTGILEDEFVFSIMGKKNPAS